MSSGEIFLVVSAVFAIVFVVHIVSDAQRKTRRS